MTDQANNEEVASEAAAERNARHKRAMERKKAYIDGNIAAATIDADDAVPVLRDGVWSRA